MFMFFSETSKLEASPVIALLAKEVNQETHVLGVYLKTTSSRLGFLDIILL